ncbi:MAG: hypothetical protein ACAH88_11095 [Roseimicrobium sp.]
MLGIIVRETGKRFLQGLPFTIFMMLVMAVGMYFLNLFLIGWMNDGWRFDTPKRWLEVTLKWLGFFKDTTDASGKIVPKALIVGGMGGSITVGVLLFIVPTVLMGFLKQGPVGAIRQFLGGPGMVIGVFRDTPRAAFSGICAGAGTGLVIGALVFGYSSLALAAGLGVFVCTNGGRVVSLLLSSIWGATYATAKGRPEQQSSALAVGYLTMAGGCLGLVIRQAFSTPSCFVVGTLLLGAALVLVIIPTQRLGPSMPASFVWFAVLLAGLCFAPGLFADDGGFIESNRPHTLAGFLDWLREGGTVTVRDLSLIHAIFTAGLGGIFGGGLRGLSGLPPSVLEQLEPLTREPQDSRAQPPGGGGSGSSPPQLPQSPPTAPPGPPLIDPRTGEPLLVNDGSYPNVEKGKVWYGGSWMDPAEVSEIIQKEKDNEADYQRRRQQQQEEADDRLRQRREEARNAPDPAVVEAQKRQETLDRMRGMGDNLVKGVEDPNRRDFYKDFLERHGNDPAKLREALDAVRNQMGADGYKAQGDAEFWGGMQTTAEDIRDWSMRINRGLAKFVPGGQTIVAWQGAANTGIDGYDKGGLKGAAGSLIANAADNYTRGIASNIYNNNGDLTAAASDWSKQYNPADYAKRIAQAGEEFKKGNINRGLGGLVDAGMDAADAKGDLGDAAGAIGDRMGGGSHPDTPTPPTRTPAADTPPARTPDTATPTRTDADAPTATRERTPGESDPTSTPPSRTEDTPSRTDTPTPPADGPAKTDDAPSSRTPEDGPAKTDDAPSSRTPGDDSTAPEGTPPADKKKTGDADTDAPTADKEPTRAKGDEESGSKKDAKPRDQDATTPKDGEKPADPEGTTPKKDPDDSQTPPEESRADRLKRQREEAIERLGPDHDQVKEIDKRIRDAEAGEPPKVEILKPDAPENLPEFKQGEKVPQQGPSISAEEARRPEFVVDQYGNVKRGASNPLDHIGRKESVVQVDPITGTRTVIHGPDVPESHKKGIEERMNRNLDDKIKQETSDYHDRQKRAQEALDKLVMDPADAPPKKTGPEAPEEPSTDKAAPADKAPPPEPEKTPTDENAARLERARELQRKQFEEHKKNQDDPRNQEQAQKTPTQQQQAEDRRGNKDDEQSQGPVDKSTEPSKAEPPPPSHPDAYPPGSPEAQKLHDARESLKAAEAARKEAQQKLKANEDPALEAELKKNVKDLESQERKAARAENKARPDISDRIVTEGPYYKDGEIVRVTEGKLGLPGEVRDHRSEHMQGEAAGGTGDDAGHHSGSQFGAPPGKHIRERLPEAEVKAVEEQLGPAHTRDNLGRQNWIQNEGGTWHQMDSDIKEAMQGGSEIDQKTSEHTKAGETRPYKRDVTLTETKTTHTEDGPKTETTEHKMTFLNSDSQKSMEKENRIPEDNHPKPPDYRPKDLFTKKPTTNPPPSPDDE